MEKYKKYFTKWLEAEKKPDEFKVLQEMYDNAEDGFESRFGENGNGRKPSGKAFHSGLQGTGQNWDRAEGGLGNEQEGMDEIKEPLDKYFNKSLQEIEKNWDTYQKDDELKKMAHLTKGHILLRKGQYQGERFFNPQDCYQQACVVLRQGYDPGKADFLDLMIQLTLGKYFCATAKHNQRSDYRRALDEFRDVRKKIEDNSQGKFSDWETLIWLDASIYIGIAERYLYHLKSAKLCFLKIMKLLFSISESRVSINESLDAYLDSLETWEGLSDRLKGDDNVYKGYLVEALVQLGIAYQKSRDYLIAQDICVTILKIDKDNVDAANNLGVCLRKQKIKTSLFAHAQNRYSIREGDSEYFGKAYGKIFQSLAKKGNRFARLHDIKCAMKHEKEQVTNDKDIEEEIGELIRQNPADQEVRLLQGLYYQQRDNLEESQKILKELFLQAPHIAKGTIGLKAYYNIADNLIREGNFREAIKYYERIQEECTKSADWREERIPTEEEHCAIPGIQLEDLPTGDLLAEINEGWCLMNLGNYEKAMKCYRTTKEHYKAMDRITWGSRMKIQNNLAECILHLAKGSQELLSEAKELLAPGYEEEPCNPVINRHLGYWHKLRMMALDPAEQCWKTEGDMALACFEIAELYNNKKDDEAYINAGWISVAVDFLEMGGLAPQERQEMLLKVENRLKYASGVYSIRSCVRLASFVKILEDIYEKEKGCYSSGKRKADLETKLETMYRSLARIRLYERDEGYNQFRHFMEDDAFRRLEAAKRGEILAALFPLYDWIMQVKELCRFVPENAGAGYLLPVHYTSLGTLKKLLPDIADEADKANKTDKTDNSGRLRLWNTVYMNDSFEGEAFLDMMEQVGKECSESGSRDEETKKRMGEYFHRVNRRDARGEALSPVNENIYVTSFSTQKDSLYMWIPYADDAKGCSVTFAADFFDIHISEDGLTDVSNYSDGDYPLYRVQYLREDHLKEWKSGKTKEEAFKEDGSMIKILDIMRKIWDTILDLEKRIDGKGVLELRWDTPADNQRETKLIRSFAKGCLNEVRFLFKNSEYAHEAEVRMFHYSYEPRVDMENFSIPRLYVEMERKIRIEEVKLGPKIGESQANEIVSWLTKTNAVDRITKSERHYK